MWMKQIKEKREKKVKAELKKKIKEIKGIKRNEVINILDVKKAVAK